jgi:hypothetical protein
MEAMETSGHIKNGTIDPIINTEWSGIIFKSLASCEDKT